LTDPYSITPEMVLHISKLASLELDETEKSHFAEELNAILGHMKQLKNLDTEHLEATFQTFPAVNVLRKDVPEPSLSTAEVLQNAPEKDGPFFKMPPILESDV